MGCNRVIQAFAVVSILGSSSRKISKASDIHVNSCPVKSPMTMTNHGLAG